MIGEYFAYIGYAAVAMAVIILLYIIFKSKKKEESVNMGIQADNIGDNEDDNDETDDEDEEDDEGDFDFRNALKGMTEKQLLKFLVLDRLNEWSSISFDNGFEEMIEIAKEE